MADEQKPPINIHIGDSVGQNKAGGDHMAAGDISGSGVAVGRRAGASTEGRRRVQEDDLILALNRLQEQLSHLNTEVAVLKYQVSQLNDKLRAPSSSFGPLQWWIVIIVVSIATTAAMSMIWPVVR